MMRPRGDRRSGALTREEMLATFDRGYATNTRAWLAGVWNLENATADDLASLLEDDAWNAPRYTDLDPIVRGVLSVVAQEEGRMRGENLRRDLLLAGFGDQRQVLEKLVREALLIPTPTAGELDLDVEVQLEQGTYLQRDLALPAAAMRVLETQGMEAKSPGTIEDGAVNVEFAGSTDTLELNLLHIGRLLLDHTLRLNKSGAPNRRSLQRFARGLVFPGETNEVGDADLDLSNGTQLDYISFVLGLALELGLITRDGDCLRGSADTLDAYFTADVKTRNRQLLEAFRGLRYWSELRSLRRESRTDDDLDEHLSLADATGKCFIAMRDFILSILRRSRFQGWTRLGAIREMCLEMDPSFLQDSVTKSAPDSKPREWVDAFIKRGLTWLGVLDTGRAGNTHAVRFTARGLAMLGLADTDTAHRPDQCLIVQPNLEVMVFLDAAPVEVIYQIYRLAERRKLAERVVTFALTPGSVQRGYSLGLTAEAAIELMSSSSAVPLGDSIEFQLRDWERRHQRMRVYVGGILVRHDDPDQLDLDIGQLKHEAENDVEFVRIGATAVYMSRPDPALTRFMDRNKAFRIDYLGEVPPCLDFVDPLTVMVDPVRADVVTLWELEQIAVELDDDAIPGHRFYELDIGLIEKRWPNNSLEEVTRFLDRVTEGGLPAGQYLTLRSGLIGSASAEIREDIAVLVFENEEDGDIFARVEETSGHLLERLGPRVFQVEKSALAELREVLDELGIKV